MGIEAGIAVVPHHPQLIRGHGDRGHLVVDRFRQPGFRSLFTVAEQPAVVHLQLIARQPHHPFDQCCRCVVASGHELLRRGEHHHIAPVQMAVAAAGQARPHLLHQDAVLQLQGGQH